MGSQIWEGITDLRVCVHVDVACGCCLLARPGEVHAGFGSAGRQTLTCCAPPSLPVLPRRRRPCSSGPWRLHAAAHDLSQAGGSPDQPVSRPACSAPQETAAQFLAGEATRCVSQATTSRGTAQSGRASRRQGARYVMQPCNIPSRQLCCVRLAVLSLGADHGNWHRRPAVPHLACGVLRATPHLLHALCHASPAACFAPCLYGLLTRCGTSRALGGCCFPTSTTQRSRSVQRPGRYGLQWDTGTWTGMVGLAGTGAIGNVD